MARISFPPTIGLVDPLQAERVRELLVGGKFGEIVGPGVLSRPAAGAIVAAAQAVST